MARLAKNRANEILENVEISVKYEGYIKREKELADKIKRLDEVKILGSIDINWVYNSMV